ncbi:hypothetical protein ABT095_15810 [Kitasatospora sp. NPDC002227]|uniref:hypothetical protein n=1 Tax=Kitasatospora sp. NPDC002227 TaxID=3154773 RepID=UPI0033232A16
MKYSATVARAGAEPREPKTVDTAEHAAGLLWPLLKANGWAESEESALAVLVSCEPLTFKGFVYKVTEIPA